MVDRVHLVRLKKKYIAFLSEQKAKEFYDFSKDCGDSELILDVRLDEGISETLMDAFKFKLGE